VWDARWVGSARSEKSRREVSLYPLSSCCRESGRLAGGNAQIDRETAWNGVFWPFHELGRTARKAAGGSSALPCSEPPRLGPDGFVSRSPDDSSDSTPRLRRVSRSLLSPCSPRDRVTAVLRGYASKDGPCGRWLDRRAQNTASAPSQPAGCARGAWSACELQAAQDPVAVPQGAGRFISLTLSPSRISRNNRSLCLRSRILVTA
jgi:hypothetical protein